MRPNRQTPRSDTLTHSVRGPRQTLFVLHSDLRFGERLARAAESSFRVARLRCWGDLVEQFAGAPPATLVVVDPYFGTGEDDGPSDELGVFLRRFPSAVVIAAFWHRHGRYRDVWALSRCGVAELLFLDEENSEALIGRRLAGARVRPVRELVQTLQLPLAGRAEMILEAATEVVASGGMVRDLARKLCLSRQTLLRRCQTACLPPPRDLLRWVRALHAAAMLDDPGHSVRSVSQACGYADDRGLRRLFHGVAEMPPSQLRERGALRIVEGSFRASLAAREYTMGPRRVA
jgi:AraC-like DNA-binding protein